MEKLLASYDPSNGELLGELQVASMEEIDVVVSQAREAYKKWRKLSHDILQLSRWARKRIECIHLLRHELILLV